MVGSKRFTVEWSDDGIEWFSRQTDDFPSWSHQFISVTRNNLNPTATYATRCHELEYKNNIRQMVLAS